MGGKYGNKRAIAPELEPDVVATYRQYHSSAKVAELYGVSDETILRILRRNGISRKRKEPEKKPSRKKRWDDSLTQIAVDMHRNGDSYGEIGACLGFGTTTVYKRLKQAGVIKDKRANLTEDEEYRICELYDQGLTNVEIAKRFGIEPPSVTRVAKRNGCKMRGKGKVKQFECVCQRCGKRFTASMSNQVYCSERCQSAVKWMIRNDRFRVANKNAERIPLREVWERDKGKCYICGKKTDWNDYRIVNGHKVCGPRYPTRDHVIAINNGGTHTWDNIKLACRGCNASKKDLGQMRLPILV